MSLVGCTTCRSHCRPARATSQLSCSGKLNTMAMPFKGLLACVSQQPGQSCQTRILTGPKINHVRSYVGGGKTHTSIMSHHRQQHQREHMSITKTLVFPPPQTRILVPETTPPNSKTPGMACPLLFLSPSYSSHNAMLPSQPSTARHPFPNPCLHHPIHSHRHFMTRRAVIL